MKSIFIGGITKNDKFGDAIKVGTAMRNIRGALTRRNRKQPPVQLSKTTLEKKETS